MRALYLKEIRGFLNSTVGYVFILIFLVATWLFHWVFNGNFLESQLADMLPFFTTTPYLFLILIPAITMRSIADERRTGTIELLYTRPISDLGILLAKYLAGVTLLFISLLPTTLYYGSVHYLGDPVGIIDDGATLTSFIGLFLLGSCFVAVGIFASALTSSQIIAFITSLTFCYILYDGISLVGSYAKFGKLDFIIQYFGLNTHYDSIKKGVILSEDIVYFFSVIALFLLASHTAIKSLKK